MRCSVCSQKINFKRLVGLYLLNTKILLCSEECEKSYSIESKEEPSVDILATEDSLGVQEEVSEPELIQEIKSEKHGRAGRVQLTHCKGCNILLPSNRGVYCSKACRYPDLVVLEGKKKDETSIPTAKESSVIRKSEIANEPVAQKSRTSENFQTVLDDCIAYANSNHDKIKTARNLPLELRLKGMSKVYQEWMGIFR